MMDMAVDCFKEKPETVTSVWLDTYKQIEAMKVLKEMSQAKGGYKADAFTWYPQTEFCYMRNAEAFLKFVEGHVLFVKIKFHLRSSHQIITHTMIW